ncbi:nuclear transport factor 2 family protein [Sphingobacterium corticis]|uniref:Nuclear transport factor 2 family protein n=1 Tax=Sphingobacterium corticis TaxID=1812823 RepID=A0ABW5NLK0_9SPHI
MRIIYVLFISILLSSCMENNNQSSESSGQDLTKSEVEKTMESFRMALLQANQDSLMAYTDEHLSFGHSSSMLENRQQFVQSMVSGKFKFTELEFRDLDIAISNETAIVRHTLSGKSADEGKLPGNVNIHVLLVWQKKDGAVKLLARQAVKFQ